MSGLVRTYAAQAGAAARSAAADRRGFLLQGGAMVANNVFVLGLWFLFFAGFKSVGGWRMQDMALLNGLLAVIYGVAGVFAGGYRDLARQIVSGVPDTLLAQPKAVLPRLLANESDATGWGDILTGIVLLFTISGIRAADALWVVLVLVSGLVVYLATAIAFASIAFWAAGARSFARELTDFIVLFSLYPGSIYSGALKLVAYTLFPAAFITLIPLSVIRDPDWRKAGILLLAAVVYSCGAFMLFSVGLKRYQLGEAPMSAD